MSAAILDAQGLCSAAMQYMADARFDLPTLICLMYIIWLDDRCLVVIGLYLQEP